MQVIFETNHKSKIDHVQSIYLQHSFYETVIKHYYFICSDFDAIEIVDQASSEIL